jgi:hypothetical protein
MDPKEQRIFFKKKPEEKETIYTLKVRKLKKGCCFTCRFMDESKA